MSPSVDAAKAKGLMDGGAVGRGGCDVKERAHCRCAAVGFTVLELLIVCAVLSGDFRGWGGLHTVFAELS